ncbi:MAG: hypothetical protein KKI02_02790 [Planctomycetes bacterium]|nr:hypothetical protein [Planctomycetota bacterium]
MLIALLSIAVVGCWPEEPAALWDLFAAAVSEFENGGAGSEGGLADIVGDAGPHGIAVAAKASRLRGVFAGHPKVDKTLGGNRASRSFVLGSPAPEDFTPAESAPNSNPPDGGAPAAGSEYANSYQFSYYRTDGHAGQGFVGCVTAQGRIGSVTGKKNHTFELDLRPHHGPALQQDDFDWCNGVAHSFVFVWDGAMATFQVDDVSLQGEFACDSINAIHLRTRANKGVVTLADLHLNDQALPGPTQASSDPGNDLHIVRVVGDFGEGVALTGTVQMDWDEGHAPKNSQLGFEITIGTVADDSPEPFTDCNANEIPDDEDVLSGASADCDADGVPDECQPDSDADGIIDACDGCPEDPDKAFAGACGCGVVDADTDGDGVFDCDDLCPDTPPDALVDVTGCEIPSVDAGNDVTLNEVMPVQLHAEVAGGTPPYSFNWSAPGWEGSSDQDPVVMPTETTTYTVTVADSSIPPNVLSDTVTVSIELPSDLHYTIVELGSLGPGGSHPSGINDLGQVVGYYRTDAEAMRAFLYSDGTLIDLGTLGGAQAYARDINNAGQVVGEAMDDNGQWRAFLWESAGGMLDLGTLGGATSAAYAVNESGQVAGFSDNGTSLHAFLYSDGVMSPLDTLDFYQSGAFDINDYGQMSGVVVPFSGDPHAVVFDGGALIDLGAEIPGGTQAWSINNVGMVTGYAWGSGEYRSFVYGAGQVVDLGTLDGFRDTYAYGLNDAGQIVGIATDPDIPQSHAFVYSGGQLIDLNDLLAPEHGWEQLTAAFAVNNAGQITGYGRINGQFRGFLLAPAP